MKLGTVGAQGTGVSNGRASGDAAGGSASYTEVSPREIRDMHGLAVVALKVPNATEIFAGFRQVLALSSSRDIEAHLPALDPAQPVVVVCPDGQCSGRLALRLAERGYAVYHLAGGLHEWHFCMRKACSA